MVKIKNRRRGPDFMIKCINFTALICWIIIFVIFVIVSISKPPPGSYLGKGLAKTWNVELMQYAFYLMFPLLLIGIIGLIINTSRHQRKTDTYSKSLILSLVLSFIGIIIYIAFF